MAATSVGIGAPGRISGQSGANVPATEQAEQVRRFAVTALAAALEDAERQHRPRAAGLSHEMRTALYPFFPARIVDGALIAVGEVELTVPALVNAIAGEVFRAEGDSKRGHAVTVGRVMVFSRMPTMQEIDWIAHEMKHVQQYTELGFHGFSERYVAHYEDVENEARAVEARVSRAASG